MTFNVQFNKFGEPNHSYIYEILHKPTGSVYVGVSEANKRYKKGYWGSACGKSNQLMHRKTILKNIDDYQKTILMYFKTFEEAADYEKNYTIPNYLKEYGKLCLNRNVAKALTKEACQEGGKTAGKKAKGRKAIHKDNIQSYCKINELQQKLSEGWIEGTLEEYIRKGENNPMFGKTHSEATKQQMQQSAIIANTPAVRLKKSKGLKGKKKTVIHCQNLSTAIKQKGSNKNKVSNTVWCTDGSKNRRIKPVDLNQFLKDNPTFREGQVFPNRKKLTHTEEHKEYLRQKAIEKNKALGHF